MILTKEQLQSITRGVVRIEEVDGWFRFFRMTESQEQYYLQEKPIFHAKACASAGVRLAFRSNSQSLTFRFRSSAGSSRVFGWFDLYQDGAMTQHFGFEGGELTEGRFSLSLREGEKNVELYFPWSRCTDVAEITLEDGATLQPLYRKRKMLCFGDSITQGFDTVYPSQSYVSRLARMLDADEINKGVGGEKFAPALLAERDAIEPDLITVAYGTNDWPKTTRDAFCEKCSAFFTRISQQYPHTKIFAIAPIWRIDCEKIDAYGEPLSKLSQAMEECCQGLSNVVLIDAFRFVPHSKDFFRDMRVHPNDAGFAHYAEGLCSVILSHLASPKP